MLLPQTSVPLDHEADKTVLKERGDSVERAITTVASLDAAQDIDNILRTQTMTMPNVDIPQGMDTGGSPKRQETMGGTPAQTRSKRVLEQPYEPPLSEGHTSGSGEGSMEQTFELTDNVPSTPHDSPLIGGYTPGSDEGRMKLDELITLCTKLSKQVLDLENEKDAQVVEILNLKKKSPRIGKENGNEEDASKQGRRSDKLKPMFKDKDFEELDDHMENVEEETVDAAAMEVSYFFDDEDVTMAMAQALIKMKEQKAIGERVAITDRYKELTQRIHKEELAELERAQQERQRQEDDTNAALAKEFDEIQARIDADHELAIRLTHEEQEKYTIEERERLLAEFFDQRKKQLAAPRSRGQ
ncbi:hypothetical protein Tco_0355515 [Tanacetum coccineum]